MGMFEGLRKKLRGSDHVAFEVTAAPQFRWGQGELPAAIVFQGAENTDKIVTQMQFTIGMKYRRRDGDDDWTEFPMLYEQRFPVPAGATTTHQVAIPLSLEAVRAQTVIDTKYPEWLQTSNLKKAENAYGKIGPHRLQVTVNYENDRWPHVAAASVESV